MSAALEPNSFESWMVELDRRVTTKLGVSVHDLADMTFRDWYDDGIRPGEAVELVCQEVGADW